MPLWWESIDPRPKRRQWNKEAGWVSSAKEYFVLSSTTLLNTQMLLDERWKHMWIVNTYKVKCVQTDLQYADEQMFPEFCLLYRVILYIFLKYTLTVYSFLEWFVRFLWNVWNSFMLFHNNLNTFLIKHIGLQSNKFAIKIAINLQYSLSCHII